MSIALAQRGAIRHAWPWAVLAVGLLLVVLNFTMHESLFHRGATSTAGSAAAGAAAPGPPPVPGTVVLAAAKLKAAGIVEEKPTTVSLPAELGVPGRIEANMDKQVQVRPRAPGVVREVKVKLGQSVKAGDLLAILDSADVGTARLELRSRQRELSTVRVEADWKRQVAANVEGLIPELRRRVESNVIEKAYADRPLGSFRSTLLPAYARFDIAAHEEEKTVGLYRQQIVGEHPTFVAKHTREGAQAEFEGIVEQAKFDSNLQSLTAAQKVKQAEANVIDAAERLRLLGVSTDQKALLDGASKVAAAPAAGADKDLTAYPIHAPFAGQILTRTAVASQPVATTDVLFTLADLSVVWVVVNIPESEFGLLPALKQGKIRVSATAYPGRWFDATLLSVGASVDPTTRAVPMTAETPNNDGLLKLGMFARIALDTATERKTLTVPGSAVVEIEGKTGVFLAGTASADGGRSFAFRPVKLGRESGDRRVVEAGLTADDAVVSRGAFSLKSELVLQNEGDE